MYIIHDILNKSSGRHECKMVGIAQLVVALDCGSRCRGFEPHYPPFTMKIVM